MEKKIKFLSGLRDLMLDSDVTGISFDADGIFVIRFAGGSVCRCVSEDGLLSPGDIDDEIEYLNREGKR